MSRHRVLTTAGLIAAAALILVPPQSMVPSALAQPTLNVRIAMNFTWQTVYMPFRYGLAKGYFKAVNIAPEILPMQGDDQALQFLEAGKVDYAFVSDAVFLSHVMKGRTESTAIYVWLDQPSYHIVSWMPLTGPSSLVGKSYATVPFSPYRNVLPYVLRKNGVDPSTVKMQTTDFSVLLPTFMNGGFDAIEIHSPGSWQYLLARASAQGKKLYLTRVADWGLTGYSKIMIVSNSRLQKNPDEVKRLVTAIDRSVKDALAHASDDETYELMKDVMPQASKAPLIADWHDFKKLVKKPGAIDPKVFETTALWLKEVGMISDIKPVDKLYYNVVN